MNQIRYLWYVLWTEKKNDDDDNSQRKNIFVCEIFFWIKKCTKNVLNLEPPTFKKYMFDKHEVIYTEIFNLS
jgi:hypothetical protein